ncbi:MAG: response regulator transcription factor [Haliea sp.]|nr:response regulator transcription factor [Haliea sp.]MDP4790019.1 response regulator transcription factor [Haliea sp.]MDP4917538.1 response regulator transcription factor [Haliea sp.]MDP5063303.1 response regulator transcription factor [Haliea sp.]
MIAEHILIVDDDVFLCKVLCYQLSVRKYHCEFVETSTAALSRLQQKPLPDLILLDYSLRPQDLNGLQLCSKIKAVCDRPVVMLTANDELRTIVSCLDAGADQYIVKPYDIEELSARVRAVLRQRESRSTKVDAAGAIGLLEWEALQLDPLQRTLSADGHEVALSEKELAVLSLLMRSPGTAVKRSDLYSIVYGRDFDSMNRAMDVLVGRARKKLKALTENYKIRSIRGSGYVLQPVRARKTTTEGTSS